MSDKIHRPSHYGEFTPMDAMGSGLFSREEFVGFIKGNILKYITRYGCKNGVEDLYKAQEYLEVLIRVEKEDYEVGD